MNSPNTWYSGFVEETPTPSDKVSQSEPESKLSDAGSYSKTLSFPSIFNLIFSCKKSTIGVVTASKYFLLAALMSYLLKRELQALQ